MFKLGVGEKPGKLSCTWTWGETVFVPVKTMMTNADIVEKFD
jgi:hypothetical protein